MKKIVVFIAALFCLFAVKAQISNPFDSLFTSYSGKTGYKTVVLGPKMIAMMEQNDGGNSTIKDKISQIRILSTEMENPELLAAATVVVQKSYELVSTTEEGIEKTSFYLNDVIPTQKSFIMIAHREGKEIIMEIVGKFNVTDITQLSSMGQKQK